MPIVLVYTGRVCIAVYVVNMPSPFVVLDPCQEMASCLTGHRLCYRTRLTEGPPSDTQAHLMLSDSHK